MNQYLSLFIWILLTLVACQSSSTDQQVETKSSGIMKADRFLPESLQHGVAVDSSTNPYLGRILSTATWIDSLGANLVIVSEGKGADNSIGKIYGRHYINGYVMWEMEDQTRTCICDCAVSLREPQLQVNDIDLNRIAEVYFIYLLDTTCGQKEEPTPTRLLLYEGFSKLELKGFSNLGNSTKPGVRSINRVGDLNKFSPAVKRKSLEYWNDFIVSQKVGSDESDE